jgi:hypothetical protein
MEMVFEYVTNGSIWLMKKDGGGGGCEYNFINGWQFLG